LNVTARSADGEVMALRHRDGLVEGVQFHPESVFTRRGIDMLANFVADVRRGSSAPRAAQAEAVLRHV
jgi:anthranilate/para-aminobenzoate synthase component II